MRPIMNFTLHATLAAALIAFASTGAAAAGAYLKLGDIKGDRAEGPGKGDWIEIDSYQWGAARGAQSGGGKREASSPSISEISVTKSTDKATPKLMEAATKGKVFGSPAPSGSMTTRVPAGTCTVGARYPAAKLDTGSMIFEMENIMVSSCSSGSGGSSSLPMEEISFNYEKIRTTYQAQDKQAPKTKVRGWDPEKKEQ